MGLVSTMRDAIFNPRVLKRIDLTFSDGLRVKMDGPSVNQLSDEMNILLTHFLIGEPPFEEDDEGAEVDIQTLHDLLG